MTISVFFVVPLIILLVLYTIIAKNLITDSAKIALNKHVDAYSLRARRQVVLMLGTVVVSFFLCLLPFRVLTLWIIIVADETVINLGVEKYYNILYFCRMMHYLSSAINPILYNLMSSKFRDGFSRVWCCRDRKDFRNGVRNRNGTLNTTTTSYNSRTQNSMKSLNTRKVSENPAASAPKVSVGKALKKSNSIDWMENLTLLHNTGAGERNKKLFIFHKQMSTPILLHTGEFNMDKMVDQSSEKFDNSLRRNVLKNCARSHTLDVVNYDTVSLKDNMLCCSSNTNNAPESYV